MPEKKTIERAKQAKRQGKAPSTQAGEFVREEMHHIREGKHGARSTKLAIAIGLSKARRAGVDLPPPKKGKTSEKTRRSAAAPSALMRLAKRASRSPPALAHKRRKRRSSGKAERRLHQGRSPSRHIRRPASARPASAQRRLEKQRKQRGPRTVPLPPTKPLALARSLKNKG